MTNIKILQNEDVSRSERLLVVAKNLNKIIDYPFELEDHKGELTVITNVKLSPMVENFIKKLWEQQNELAEYVVFKIKK